MLHLRGAPACPGISLLLAGSPRCQAGLGAPPPKPTAPSCPGPPPRSRPAALASSPSLLEPSGWKGERRGAGACAQRSSPCPALPSQQAASETSVWVRGWGRGANPSERSREAGGEKSDPHPKLRNLPGRGVGRAGWLRGAPPRRGEAGPDRVSAADPTASPSAQDRGRPRTEPAPGKRRPSRGARGGPGVPGAEVVDRSGGADR